MQDEMTFKIVPTKAERFCSWLIGIGGWAASNILEDPVVHRLIRTHNPDNSVGIPRQDLVVSRSDDSRFFRIRWEFQPLFEAFSSYERFQHKEPI